MQGAGRLRARAQQDRLVLDISASRTRIASIIFLPRPSCSSAATLSSAALPAFTARRWAMAGSIAAAVHAFLASSSAERRRCWSGLSEVRRRALSRWLAKAWLPEVSGSREASWPVNEKPRCPVSILIRLSSMALASAMTSYVWIFIPFADSRAVKLP